MFLMSNNKSVEIKSYNAKVIDFPEDKNDYRSYVDLSIETIDHNKISAYGFYQGNQTESVKFMIDSACKQAEEKIIEVLFYSPSYNNTQSYPPQQSDKSKLNGGGNKPISAGQINFIHNLAGKKNVDAAQLATQICGKNLDACVGEEAQKIINHLKTLRG